MAKIPQVPVIVAHCLITNQPIERKPGPGRPTLYSPEGRRLIAKFHSVEAARAAYRARMTVAPSTS